MDLINTADPETGLEGLADPAAAAVLLEHRGWVLEALPSEDELERLRGLRETLRSAFSGQDEHETVWRLNRTLFDLRALPQLTDHDGGWHWHYVRPGAGIVDRVTATVAAALLSVVADGGAERLRTCSAEGCRNVFADLSRNGSRRFCSSRACGNRTHAAAYRARRRSEDDDELD